MSATESASRPTYFELVAVERLMPALKKAVIYSLSKMAANPCSHCSVCAHHVLEKHHRIKRRQHGSWPPFPKQEHHSLTESDASVSESLYGLFRAPATAAAAAAGAAASAAAGTGSAGAAAGGPFGGLSRRQKWISLLFLVGTPYLRDKADKAFTVLSGGQAAQLGLLSAEDGDDGDGDDGEGLSEAQRRSGGFTSTSGGGTGGGTGGAPRGAVGGLARAAVVAYPLAMAMVDSWLFANGVAYLVGRASVHSPALRWAGLRVMRASPADVTAAGERAAARRALAAGSVGAGALGVLRTGALQTWWAVSDLSRPTLVGAVVGFKLLEWWYLAGEKRVGAGDTLPVPPPPQPLSPALDGVPLPRDPRLCPLCRRLRTNPAVLACSGYVFCYPCLFDHVQRTACCPVSRVPAGIESIRRLFQM